MDIEAAIGAIKSSELEGKDEIVKIITKRISDLSRESAKTSRNEALVNQLLEAIGTTEGDLEAKIHAATTKVKALSNDLTTAQGKVTELEAQTKSLEKRSLVHSASLKAGVVPEVLERLLEGNTDELVIADDGVKLGGKPLKDYAEGNAAWKPFLPALFTSTQDNKQKDTQLPTGSQNGKDGSKADPVKSYLDSNYKVPDYLKTS